VVARQRVVNMTLMTGHQSYERNIPATARVRSTQARLLKELHAVALRYGSLA
jgi:hypothetical protein